VFVDDRKAFSTRVYPSLASSTGIDVFAEGGAATAKTVDVWRLGTDTSFPEPDETTGDASEVQLLPNVPNPMRGSTTIGFALPSAQRATLSVYDPRGRHVATLYDRRIGAGTKAVTGAPSGMVASGIYFYRLHTNIATRTRKLMVVTSSRGTH
jgi:hypothetical protein